MKGLFWDPYIQVAAKGSEGAEFCRASILARYVKERQGRDAN